MEKQNVTRKLPMRGSLSKPGLRPWPGRKLPDELRPENVGRLAEALAEDVRDAEFERWFSGEIDFGQMLPIDNDMQQAS